MLKILRIIGIICLALVFGVSAISFNPWCDESGVLSYPEKNRWVGIIICLIAGTALISLLYSEVRQQVKSGRSRRTHRRTLTQDRNFSAEMAVICMMILRIFSAVLPFFYAAVLAVIDTHGVTETVGILAFALICLLVAVLSILFAVSIFMETTWGLVMGYLLAVLNLIVFPVGTGVGIFLLVLLWGASPAMVALPRGRDRFRGQA